MGPELIELTIGDSPSAWERAGFTVTDERLTIGSVSIRLQEPGESGARGVTGWTFAGLAEGSVEAIDGMPTTSTERSTPIGAATHPNGVGAHPNGVGAIDHVVMMTDDLERTSAALEASGFEARRRRAIPQSEPPRSQIFWWAGDVIIELVGPDTATGDRPASVWGLALTTEDIDATAALLGELMSEPRTAVQKGRRIASLRGKTLDLSVPIAIMTPHV